jgi:excisionase family DNA binding protein
MNEQSEGNGVIGSQRLLEPKEVAKQLNVSSAFVYKLIKAGSLPAVRLGTAVRIAPADLKEFLEINRTAK